MERKVTTIPASKPKTSAAGSLSPETKKRVAAYARVSTELEEQTNSYQTQIRYYTDYINSHQGWILAGIYSDEGITGTNTLHRTGFKNMISDALNGKIDLIITKSVSRFARNTIDSLSAIRELKEHNVEIYFEKENIWTFDGKGELLITIMSSLAQEEARSISENTTWSVHKRFAEGKGSLAFSRFLGYDCGPDGEYILNPEEAKTVKRIYSMYLQGYCSGRIKKILNDEHVPTATKKGEWHISSVLSILKNEKYKGDVLLQKTYNSDFLTKKRLKNNSHLPKYYVENDHEAIISPEIFDIVQAEIKKDELAHRLHHVSRGNYAFTGKIYCAKCGWGYTRYGRPKKAGNGPVWQCYQAKNSRRELCDGGFIESSWVQDSFVKALNSATDMKNEVVENANEMLQYLSSERKKARVSKRISEYAASENQLTYYTDEVWNALADNVTVEIKTTKINFYFQLKNGKKIKVSMKK